MSYKSGNIIAFMDNLVNNILYRERYDEISATIAVGLKVAASLESCYLQGKGLDATQEKIFTEPDYFDAFSHKKPRYYQRIAIDKTIEVIAKGQDRILLVMATGTGKTYTAFQIIWKLFKMS